MIQKRFENEQFTTLPELLSQDRSRNGFISTDRPDSSQRVDLHVYLVPKSVWRNVQHLAQNQAMDEAISAGFVRVSPDLTLRDLRDPIEKLCRNENYFPRDFIFLRSVGRCLTRVKSGQEIDLKVKNYRPPQTFAPEIYLLEGRHEDYANLPSPSPALSSASYLFGNRYQHHLRLDDHGQTSSRLSQFFNPPRTIREEKRPLAKLKKLNSLSCVDKSGHNSTTGDSSTLDESPKKNLIRVKEEQERLRQRQIELERIRRIVEARKSQKPKTIEVERQEEKGNHSLRRQGKLQPDRFEREQEEKAATKIQAIYRGFKSRQATRERRRNEMKSKTQWQIDEDQLSDCSEISSRLSSSDECDGSRSATRTIRKASSMSSLNSSRESLSSYSETVEDEQPTRSATVTKSRPSDDNSLPSASPEMSDPELELQQREAKLRQTQQFEEERRKAKEAEEKRRRDISKRHLRYDPEAMRRRLEEIRSKQNDLIKLRDETIKNLKMTHQRITIRRKEARDMWKKKYYSEKKKTPPLEEQNKQLKTDLDQIHQKILQTIDNESQHSAHNGHLKEAEIDNCLAQITRVQHEVENVHYQLDQAKLRLTTDIKLRHQAENECRTLRHELNQAKMNLNQIKIRQEI